MTRMRHAFVAAVMIAATAAATIDGEPVTMGAAVRRSGRTAAAPGPWYYPEAAGPPPPASGRSTRMRKGLLVVVGAVVTIAGVVWLLQGIGYLKGSMMTGSSVWAVTGPLVALAGIAMIALGLRARRR